MPDEVMITYNAKLKKYTEPTEQLKKKLMQEAVDEFFASLYFDGSVNL